VVHLPDPLPDETDAQDAAKALPSQVAAEPMVAPDVGDARRLEPSAQPPKDVPRPIGPEALRALRDAIRNGTYPSDSDVMGGLVRMFREPDASGPISGAESNDPKP
jgi:hypothetical protein